MGLNKQTPRWRSNSVVTVAPKKPAAALSQMGRPHCLTVSVPKNAVTVPLPVLPWPPAQRSKRRRFRKRSLRRKGKLRDEIGALAARECDECSGVFRVGVIPSIGGATAAIVHLSVGSTEAKGLRHSLVSWGQSWSGSEFLSSARKHFSLFAWARPSNQTGRPEIARQPRQCAPGTGPNLGSGSSLPSRDRTPPRVHGRAQQLGERLSRLWGWGSGVGGVSASLGVSTKQRGGPEQPGDFSGR